MQYATRRAARQRTLRDGENFGGEVSFEPPSRFTSLDHLVGAGEQRRRNFEAKRLSSFEVDDQLVFGRCLHRQVSGLRPIQDAINVAGRAAVLVENIWSI